MRKYLYLAVGSMLALGACSRSYDVAAVGDCPSRMDVVCMDGDRVMFSKSVCSAQVQDNGKTIVQITPHEQYTIPAGKCQMYPRQT